MKNGGSIDGVGCKSVKEKNLGVWIGVGERILKRGEANS